MALQDIGGIYQIPAEKEWASTPGFLNAITLDASTEYTILVLPLHKAGVLDALEFRTGSTSPVVTGTVRVEFGTMGADGTTFSSLSAYRDLTSTQITGANTWIKTGIMSSDGTDTGTPVTVSASGGTINVGDLLAVKIFWQAFNTGDTLTLSGLQITNTYYTPTVIGSAYSVYNTGSTTRAFQGLVYALRYSDDTFVTLPGTWPASAWNQTTFNSSTTDGSGGDERGLRFQLAYKARVVGVAARVKPLSNVATFQIVLYDAAGTAITNGTITVDPDQGARQDGTVVWTRMFPAAITLSAATTYHLMIKPTSTNNVNIEDFDVFNTDSLGTARLAGCQGGQQWYHCYRTDGGSISTTTTKRPVGLHLLIDQLDDGASSGGGGGGRAGTVYQPFGFA